MNKDYKKINLRDFRHKFTQLKDSIASGQIYEVIEKGNSLGYFVPKNYEVIVKNKAQDNINYGELLRSIKGSFERKDEVKHIKDIKEAYHHLLDIKYKKYRTKK